MAIQKLLELSTKHLSQRTKDQLIDYDFANVQAHSGDVCPFHAAAHCHGWMFWVPDESDLQDMYPNDLLQVLLYAKRLGCEWVNFDHDTEILAELPVYDGDEPRGTASVATITTTPAMAAVIANS